MKFEDEFRDLAPLSPKLDLQRWSRMVAAVEAAAEPELARRRSHPFDAGLFGLLGEWLRPTASAAIAMASAAGLFLALEGDATATITPGISDDLGYSAPVAAWIETDWAPSVEELLVAMNGDL